MWNSLALLCYIAKGQTHDQNCVQKMMEMLKRRNILDSLMERDSGLLLLLLDQHLFYL